jgi:hypothetical protein
LDLLLQFGNIFLLWISEGDLKESLLERQPQLETHFSMKKVYNGKKKRETEIMLKKEQDF